jgi:signal transduction histidine kinase
MRLTEAADAKDGSSMKTGDIGGAPVTGEPGGRSTLSARRVLGRRGGRSRSARAEARLTQERRRLAADLHDLVMQDLSYALATVRAIAHDPSRAAEMAPAAAAAAERSLASSRTILDTLGEQDRLPVAERVERDARQAARGTALVFRVSLEEGARTDEPTADALSHIARESVTNAVKHGRARNISVSLTHADEWRLLVRDDGRGLPEERNIEQQGFGTASMRRYAETLGGSFEIRNAADGGTEVEVSVP